MAWGIRGSTGILCYVLWFAVSIFKRVSQMLLPCFLEKKLKKPVVLVASHGFPLHFVSGGGAARYARTDLKRDSRVM
jgi:hypothetical protein